MSLFKKAKNMALVVEWEDIPSGIGVEKVKPNSRIPYKGKTIPKEWRDLVHWWACITDTSRTNRTNDTYEFEWKNSLMVMDSDEITRIYVEGEY